jgi:hypothetical protein
MRHPAAATVLAAVLALFPAPSAADPFTGAFTDLRAELEHRRDDDLAGELDAAGKKQLKAITKSLKALDKEADDLGDDLRTAGKISAALEKAVPGEFGAVGSHGELLGELCADVDLALTAEVEAARDALEDRLAGLSEKGAAKAQAALDKADEALDAAAAGEAGSKASFQLLGKALKSVGKGTKAADKDPGPGTTTLTMTVGGDPIVADADTKVEIYRDNDGFVLAGDGPRGGGHASLFLQLPEVTGPGTYPLTGPGVTCFLNHQPNGLGIEPTQIHNATSGSITITIYNRKGRMAGTFSFTGNAEGVGDLVVSEGVFDVANIESY